MSKRRRLVRVEWDDVSGMSGWLREEDAVHLEMVRCVSVGVILQKTAQRLLMASTWDDEGKVSNTTLIPRSVVRNIQRLEAASPPGRARAKSAKGVT